MKYKTAGYGSFDDSIEASYSVVDKEASNLNDLEVLITQEDNYLIGTFYNKKDLSKNYFYVSSIPKEKTAFILRVCAHDLDRYFGNRTRGKLKINAWVIELFLNVLNNNDLGRSVYLISVSNDNKLSLNCVSDLVL